MTRPHHAQPSLLAPDLPTRARVVRIMGVAGCVVAACAAVAGGLVTAAALRPAAAAVHPQPVALARPVGSASSSSTSVATPVEVGAPITSAVPPSASSSARSVAPDDAPILGLAADGIPSTALLAYEEAATREAARQPACGLTWPLLAAIGRVESNHGRFAGAVLHADGLSTPRIIGIALNGHGTALIRDTDHGRLDGDKVYDHAVGPMQFIPSTWAHWGVDANHDGVKDPFNIFDAAAAAADYLCAAGRNLTTVAGQEVAIRSYNDSDSYIATVMSLEAVYARGIGITVPVLPTAPTPGTPQHRPPLPPVNPGPPPALHPTPPPPHSSPPRSSSPPSSSTPPATSTSAPPPSGTQSPTGTETPPGPTCTPAAASDDTPASSAGSTPPAANTPADCTSSPSPSPDTSSSGSSAATS